MSLVPINFPLATPLVKDGMRHETIASLPPEILLKILSYLDPGDLNRCCQVNREWNVLANDDALWKAMSSAIIYGAAHWQKYFGEVGAEPPLPPNIYKILQNPCPFWPGKRVAETQLLVLIPSTVNGKPLTLNTLQQLIQNPREGGYATKYDFYYEEIRKELGDQSVSASYWALMTKDIISNSKGKTYAEQQALIKEPYAVPKALEIAAGILMHHAQTKEKLYSNNPYTFTRCQENLAGGWRVVVGAFGSSGLRLYLDNVGLWNNFHGVGGVRKF